MTAEWGSNTLLAQFIISAKRSTGPTSSHERQWTSFNYLEFFGLLQSMFRLKIAIKNITNTTTREDEMLSTRQIYMQIIWKTSSYSHLHYYWKRSREYIWHLEIISMNENKTKKMHQTDKRKLRATWNENRSSVGMKFWKKFNKLLQLF